MDSMASKEQPPPLRTKVACEECRKNKRKCQGQKPICALCKKGGKLCHYPPELSRKRKHYDDGYIRNLEDKVKVLEAQLESYRKSEPQYQNHEEHMGHEILPTPVPASTDYTSPPADETEVVTPEKEGESNGPRSQAAMEELASLMLTMDIEEKGEPSFTIPSGKDKYSLRQNKILIDNLNFDPNHHNASSAEDRFCLETRRHLVECFMNAFNVYHQFVEQLELPCVLSETTFSTELDLGFRNHALLSVGAFLSSNSDSKELSSHHAISAENALFRCVREHPSDLAVQGLALLSWRELMLENNSMAYTYIAMATGLILHLGLHVSNLGPGKLPDSISNLNSTTDDYIRKRRIRSFWAYFSVDRMVTSSLGMNCTIHWQRIRMSSFIGALDHDPLLDELAHDKFCHLWHLWDSFMDQRLGFSSYKVQSTYKNPGSETLSFALRSATNAAASIARIVRAYRKFRGFADVNPQIIDYILSAAVIHLLNATSGRNFLGRQSANSLRGCLDALVEIQNIWMPQASRAIRQIQELANRWKVVWALPLQLSQRLPATETPQDHNQTTIPPQEWTSIPASTPPIPYDCNIGAIEDGHMYTGFRNDFGNLWDPSLFENALEHVNLPEHIAYQSSLEWLFDENARMVHNSSTFAEAFIPGYPAWIWTRPVDPVLSTIYIQNSLVVDSDEMRTIQVVRPSMELSSPLDFSENDHNSLYIAQAIIDADGTIVMKRRKLKATHMERTIFGDASGDSLMNVAPTRWWARAMVHVETRLSEPFQVYAIESQTFVLHATTVITEKGVKANSSEGGLLMSAPGGGSSAIIGPDWPSHVEAS
ncbi:hypothetical protein DID88_002794 [Monilinia fructigena]|uniref:Zn(2)-C6 fungal-type domain-containing protein n=1 Tax=Monilinia fructigena TaxID=38457 RepID=A0A395INP8_9HELO|nr:hypothetical protein DID88_002794 [Monilinia fructigena]